jgi:hypothetical protein
MKFSEHNKNIKKDNPKFNKNLIKVCEHHAQWYEKDEIEIVNGGEECIKCQRNWEK